MFNFLNNKTTSFYDLRLNIFFCIGIVTEKPTANSPSNRVMEFSTERNRIDASCIRSSMKFYQTDHQKMSRLSSSELSGLSSPKKRISFLEDNIAETKMYLLQTC